MSRPRLVSLAILALAPLGLVAGISRAAEPAPQTAAINELIRAKWAEAEIKKPAARSTDAEFLRRAFIDIVGRIATPEEFADFEADQSADKRAKLVSRLLYSSDYKPRVNGAVVKLDGKAVLKFDYADEYADHWATTWTTWLLSRSAHATYRKQTHAWLMAEFSKPSIDHKELATKLLTATGKSNENGAVNFIGLQLGEATPRERRAELGPFDAVPATSRVTRLFLGLQTQCTQCHDHPFNKEWVQSDFWGVNAFFRQVKLDGTPTRPTDPNAQMMAFQQLGVGDTTATNREGRIFYERRDGQVKSIKPVFLKDMAQAERGERSEKTVPEDAATRREALAQFVVGHDNFAKAYVNRIWGHLFGRGLNKDAAVDDFGSHNEVVHPELLSKLAEEFAKYNHDPKKLLEWICNSDAYQLSHVANKDYADPKYDAYFARMPLKALPPEVLFESITVATRSDSQTSPELSKAKKDERDRWMAKLVTQFGDDEGNEMTFNGTVVQALLMMNGREINAEIGAKGANAVARVVARRSKSGTPSADLILDDLFVMVLNRHIAPEERVKLKGVMSKGALLPGEKPKADSPGSAGAKWPAGKPVPPAGVVLPTGAGDVTFYQDVFWALLNTNEFMLNH